MKKALRITNILLTVGISALFLWLAVFVFRDSYLRFFEGLRDFLNSMKIYFFEITGMEYTTPATVENFSGVMRWEIFLPDDFSDFCAKASSFLRLLICKDHFTDWKNELLAKVGKFAKIFAILLPCLIILALCVKKLYKRHNNRYNEDTIPLTVFKHVTGVTVRPAVYFVKQYCQFLAEIKPLIVIWCVLWTMNLNFGSIIAEFLAYYFYFAVSYRVQTLYLQFCKLFIDLQVVFRVIPVWTLPIFVYLIWNRFRKKIAMRRLHHMEARNCGFIKELPIVSMTCGSMGKKKTTVITDMALSQEVMFRQEAFSRLQKADMKFPFFPWICFEKELRCCMEYGTVYNLAGVKEWIEKKRKRYEKHGDSALQLYGYDVARYGYTYDDRLKVETLFDVLETYAELYFIYVIESSLIVSNYSIREDNMLLDEDNFPIWSFNFFPTHYPPESRYAHILDFDVLRLGRKVVENNPKAGSFEFGVVVISEVGKERGNNLELKEVKKGTEETNQKNDLFNSWLKMCRHSATVDNFPFIKVFTDEQRPESWGADARDLCDIVHILGSGDQNIALPFYTIEEMISEWVFDKFSDIYYDLRYLRGDNTLLMYLFKGITAWISTRHARIYNTYGYSISRIEKERGTQKGKAEKKKYFVMNKKIYSRRFSTDCFSDYFNELARKSGMGLGDYVAYATEKASVAELKQQNSYFIQALYKDTDSGL